MKSTSLLRDMVVTCAVMAIAAVAVGALTGYLPQGLGLAAGLALGSLNGFLIQGLMARGTPFAASGLLRIMFFSSLVLVAAFALHAIAWTLPLGIGLAQLVMVGVGVRQGLRA
jgi:hypothetical protein